jgi:hypothetical protein
MQPAHWSRAWKRDSWLRRLSGLTSPRSTLDRGAAAFIASLPEIPVRKTALPESSSDLQARASSPLRSFESRTSAGLIVSSARTFRGMQTDSLRRSSQHWSDWATALRLEYSARPESERATDASDCSSWPTPMAGTPAQNGNNAAGNSDFSRKAMTLADQLPTWSTPRASDGEKGGPNMSFGAGGVPLPSQAANWASPTARIYKGGGQAVTRADGKSRLDMLDWQAEAWTPSSAQALPIDAGPTSSPERRTLNPLFVEWLMGWPIGWTDCGSAGMEFTRWQQDMRGLLSTLCSRTPRQATLL